eukprot:155770_1
MADLEAKAVNLIDAESAFCVSAEDFQDLLKHYGINKTGTQYAIVAIMGGQSGGKSTLMNLLFGTKFDTLDASRFRRATTKGIWLAASKFHSDTLVMDLEGTDSDEKDEGLVETFARQGALFALALAEVLIVNLWEHDIGKRNAQNLTVLETIFEVNLSLSEGSNRNRTKLMFTIRDHNEAITPLKVVEDVVLGNVKELWSKIAKPDAFKDAAFTDLFDVEFVGIRHYNLQREQFMEDVTQLKNRFLNADDPTSVWDSEDHFKKSSGVPINALHSYISQLWGTICTHDELNIMSQKSSLTNTLCEKHMEESYQEFTRSVSPFLYDLEKGVVKDFGSRSASALEEAVSRYDAEAYVSSEDRADTTSELGRIKARRREQLRLKVSAELERLFERQMRHGLNVCTEMFEALMEDGVPSDGTAVANFTELATSSRKETEEKFNEIRKGSLVEDFEWSTDRIWEELQDSIQRITSEGRSTQLQCLRDEVKKHLKLTFASTVAAYLKRADKDLWKDVYSARCDAQVGVEKLMKRKLSGFECSPEELSQIQTDTAEMIISVIFTETEMQIEFIDQILKRRFDSIFRVDEDGVPRTWKPEDDIRPVYKKARQEALEILNIYAKYESCGTPDSKSNETFASEKVFIRPDKLEDIKLKFLQDITGSLREAEAQQNQTLTKVPKWAIAMMLLLGFNEIWAVLTNPFLFTLLLVFGAAFFSVHQLNMGGTLLTVAKTWFRDFVQSDHVQNTLSQFGSFADQHLSGHLTTLKKEEKVVEVASGKRNKSARVELHSRKATLRKGSPSESSSSEEDSM